jgi:hypothetical protein
VSRSVVAGGEQPTFVPTYEWAAVEEGQAIPSGLEIKMVLTDHHPKVDGGSAPESRHSRHARIPHTWRLQLYVGVAFGFVRQDVQRDSTIAQIEAAMRAALHPAHGAHTRLDADGSQCMPRVELWSGGERLPPQETVEETDLFGKRGALAGKLFGCDDADGVKTSAAASLASSPESPAAGPTDGQSRSQHWTQDHSVERGAEAPVMLLGAP